MNNTHYSMRTLTDPTPSNKLTNSLYNITRTCIDMVNTNPLVDLIQRDKKFLVSVELPGIRREDISLEISGRSLIIKATYREKKPRESDSVYLEERKRSDIYRYIYMPHNADLNKLENARYKDGVLHIQIPEINMGIRNTRIIPVRSD